MKVAFFVSNYSSDVFPQKGYFFKVICEGLAKQGIEVAVIAPMPYTNKWIEKLMPRLRGYSEVPRKEYTNGVIIHRPRYMNIPFMDKLRMRHYFMYSRAKRIIKKFKPDIIDFRNSFPSYPYGNVVMRISSKYHTPYIYTINGEEYPVVNAPELDLKQLSKYIQKSAASFAVSNYIVNSVRSKTSCSLSLITHPINLLLNSNYVENKNNVRTKLHLDINKRYILFAGAISNQKGVDILLNAFRLLNRNDTVLILIGSFDNSSQYSFGANEIWLDAQKQSVVYDYMKACDIFVFPSRNEGMPNVLKEAGAAGIPIIASNAGGIPDILDSGERGEIVLDTNALSYAKAIEYAFENYEEALTKAQKMQQHIEEHYLVFANTNKLIELYKQIINYEK